MVNKKNAYAPKDRTGYEPKPSDLISYGKYEPNFTMIPSVVEDSIVVNNISYPEFDYTEDLNFDDFNSDEEE